MAGLRGGENLGDELLLPCERPAEDVVVAAEVLGACAPGERESTFDFSLSDNTMSFSAI